MKTVANYLNFVFHNVIKTKFSDIFLNFVFQLSKARNGTLGTRIQFLIAFFSITSITSISNTQFKNVF